MKYFIIFIIFIHSLLALELDDYSFEDGEKIYNETCISCHGENGDAKTYLHLTVRPRSLTKSILNMEQIFLVIKNGSHEYGAKADIMPSFGSVYSDEEIYSVAYFVFEKFTKQKNSKKLIQDASKLEYGSPKIGKKIFKRNCSLCHGIKGGCKSEFIRISKQSKKFIYPYNLQKIILDENQIFLYAKYGGKFWGTFKNDMPSWQKKYDDKSLKAVAKYINEYIKKR